MQLNSGIRRQCSEIPNILECWFGTVIRSVSKTSVTVLITIKGLVLLAATWFYTALKNMRAVMLRSVSVPASKFPECRNVALTGRVSAPYTKC